MHALLAAPILAALALAAQEGPARAAVEPSPRDPLPIGPAPPFTLPSLRELRLLSSADFAGKVVYLTIVRSDCPACLRNAPYGAEIRERYGARGLEVVAVADENFDPAADPVERVLRFADTQRWFGPIALNDGGEFHEGYYQRIKGTPSAYLIRRNGEADFLGQDPARPEYREDLERLLERRLAEPPPVAPPPTPPTPPLPDVTLLSWKGGALPTASLRGKPALVALISPALAARHGPVLAALAAKYGPVGLRVVAVLFGSHREVADFVASSAPAYEIAVPDAEAQQKLVSDNYLPKFLFVAADGRIVKSIQTIYGTRQGIEAAVFERLAAMLAGQAPEPPAASQAKDTYKKLAYHHPELGFGLDPPKGFRAADAAPGERARFVGSGSLELSVRLDVSQPASDVGIERLADSLGARLEGRHVDGREWRGSGASRGLLLREGWSSPLGATRALRLLAPGPGGVYVVTALGTEAEFAPEKEALEAALLSFRGAALPR